MTISKLESTDRKSSGLPKQDIMRKMTMNTEKNLLIERASHTLQMVIRDLVQMSAAVWSFVHSMWSDMRRLMRLKSCLAGQGETIIPTISSTKIKMNSWGWLRLKKKRTMEWWTTCLINSSKATNTKRNSYRKSRTQEKTESWTKERSRWRTQLSGRTRWNKSTKTRFWCSGGILVDELAFVLVQTFQTPFISIILD